MSIDTITTDNYYRQLFEKKLENAVEEVERIKNKPLQTGANAYTQKQWDAFIQDYDRFSERAREQMRARHEKQYEKQLEQEERAREAVMEDYLEAVESAKRLRAKERKEATKEEYL